MDNSSNTNGPNSGNFSKVYKFDSVQPDGSLAQVSKFDFKGRETSSELYADYELTDLLQITQKRFKPDGSCEMLIRYAKPQPQGVRSCVVLLRSNGAADIKKYYRNIDYTGLIYSIKTHYAADGSYTHTVIYENSSEMSSVMKYNTDDTLQYIKFYRDNAFQDLFCVQIRTNIKDGYTYLYSFTEQTEEGYQSKVDVFDNNDVMTSSSFYKTKDFKDLLYVITYQPFEDGEVHLSWMYKSDQGGWFSKIEEYSSQGYNYRTRYFKDDKFETLFRVEEFDEEGTIINSEDY